jgi:hypothetical protein
VTRLAAPPHSGAPQDGIHALPRVEGSRARPEHHVQPMPARQADGAAEARHPSPHRVGHLHPYHVPVPVALLPPALRRDLPVQVRPVPPRARRRARRRRDATSRRIPTRVRSGSRSRRWTDHVWSAEVSAPAFPAFPRGTGVGGGSLVQRVRVGRRYPAHPATAAFPGSWTPSRDVLSLLGRALGFLDPAGVAYHCECRSRCAERPKDLPGIIDEVVSDIRECRGRR